MRRIPAAELAGADPRRGAVGDSGAGKRRALGHAGQWRTPAGALRGAASAAGGSWCGSRPERIGRSRSTTPVSSRIAQEAKSIASCPKVCRDPARISAIPMRRIPLQHLRSSSSSATGRPFDCVSSVCQSRPRTRIPGSHAEHRSDVARGIQPGPDTIRFLRPRAVSPVADGREFQPTPPLRSSGPEPCSRAEAASPHPSSRGHRGVGIKPGSALDKPTSAQHAERTGPRGMATLRRRWPAAARAWCSWWRAERRFG